MTTSPTGSSASPGTSTEGVPNSRNQIARTDGPVVVDPQQRDHVVRVVGVLDPPRGPALLAGEDRVVVDPARVVELLPYGLREAEVGHAVTVDVADLAPADLEGELAAAARAGGHAGPGRHFEGDDLVGCHAGNGPRKRGPFPLAIGPRTGR